MLHLPTGQVFLFCFQTLMSNHPQMEASSSLQLGCIHPCQHEMLLSFPYQGLFVPAGLRWASALLGSAAVGEEIPLHWACRGTRSSGTRGNEMGMVSPVKAAQVWGSHVFILPQGLQWGVASFQRH